MAKQAEIAECLSIIDVKVESKSEEGRRRKSERGLLSGFIKPHSSALSSELCQKQEVIEVCERPTSSAQRRSCGVESNQPENIKGTHECSVTTR
ncbi:hypothetical protein PHYPO_G00129990 [Pangasianodon hypophthalmus]|uniref:Uncharacterized protein n=1 Tax=Pangasianodon hypophthalmus TaxID=310915 RepID=A0A5N5KSB7_PANHP|nr:hypothetical protein PHYPO_G00129990 [Pangasianodon hypophthalmus]